MRLPRLPGAPRPGRGKALLQGEAGLIPGETLCGMSQDTVIWGKSAGWLRRKRMRFEVCAYCCFHSISILIGKSFLTGSVRSDGGSILKSDRVAGMVPLSLASLPCDVS